MSNNRLNDLRADKEVIQAGMYALEQLMKLHPDDELYLNCYETLFYAETARVERICRYLKNHGDLPMDVKSNRGVMTNA